MVVAKYQELPPIEDGDSTVKVPSGDITANTKILQRFNGVNQNGKSTGPVNNTCKWLRECCRQVDAEVVSNSRNQLHQTIQVLFPGPVLNLWFMKKRKITRRYSGERK